MYSKLALFVASAFALGAIAAPGGEPAAPALPAPVINNSQCDVGKIDCCESTQDAESSAVQNLAGLFGLNLGSITGLVGVNCGLFSGSSCTAQPVCCTGNSFSGLIVVGCSPINVSV